MTEIIIYQFFPAIVLLVLSFVTIFNGSGYLIASFILIMPYLCRQLAYLNNKTLIYFFILVLIGSLFNLLSTQNGIGGTINFIVSIAAALFCIEHLNYSRYLVLTLCLYTVFFIYQNVFVLCENIESVYDNVGLSKNYPGYIMVVCCCYWTYVKYLISGEISLILPILCTVFAFFLDGRSSLGILFILSCFCLFLRFRHRILLVMPLLVALVYIYGEDIMTYYHMTNLSESGMETSRYTIWNEYMNHLDFGSLLFGLDTLSVPFLKNYGGNPHNAFLNFHYRMGLLGLLGLCYLILKSIFRLLKYKSFVLFILVILLLGRIFFDACIGSSTDYLLYAIFLFPLFNREEQRKRHLTILEKYL